MTERTRLGTLFGAPGMYVSQAGDPLNAPTKPLMLDSRCDVLEIHATGRVSLPDIDTTGSTVTHQREVFFPSLGYIPQFDYAVVANSGNEIFYPPSLFQLGGGSLFFPQDQAAHISADRFLYRVLIPTPVRSFDLWYVIYKNPRNPTVLPSGGTERVFIGNDQGTFKMRVSKPGYHARSATRDQCLIHEDKRPLIPVATGVVSVPARVDMSSPPATLDVGTGIGFSFPPKLLNTARITTRLNLSSGVLRFYNFNTFVVTTRYAIYHPA